MGVSWKDLQDDQEKSLSSWESGQVSDDVEQQNEDNSAYNEQKQSTNMRGKHRRGSSFEGSDYKYKNRDIGNNSGYRRRRSRSRSQEIAGRMGHKGNNQFHNRQQPATIGPYGSQQYRVQNQQRMQQNVML